MTMPRELDQHLQGVKRQMANIAWRVLQDADDAEDAIQDAMTNIWARRRRVLAHPNPKALILRMCFQCAIDRFRTRARRQTAPIPDWLGADSPPPDDAMVKREMLDQVRRQMALLPGQQADAIYLRVIEQMPYRDVAAAIGCDESTARVHVRRARRKLRRELAPLIPNEVCHG